jgi:tetratricopeptide (TPR) repeat protein
MAENRLCGKVGSVSFSEREAWECLEIGLKAGRAGEFDRALRKLQQGRESLGEVDDLRLYLQLCNGMAETYSQAARWQESVSLCQDTLARWGDSPYHFELLQTLFYVTYAHYWLDQIDQGFAVLEEWSGKLSAETSRSQCVLLCTQANKLKLQGENEEAEQLFEKALQLDQTPSYIVTCSRRHLADVCAKLGKTQKAELAYLQACEQFTAYFPKAYAFSCCLRRIGYFYKDKQRFQEAKKQYQLAKQSYLARFPITEGYAACLEDLGDLYEKMNRPHDAEQQFLKAIQLCSVHFPRSQTYADCVHSLGIFYSHMNRTKDAEKQYILGIQLYSTYCPHDVSHAWCVHNLGNMYNSTEKPQKAIEQYECGIQLCSAHFPRTQVHANCLFNLGNHYFTKAKEEAGRKYQQALEIYADKFPQAEGYPRCLKNLGLVYQETKETAKSEILFQRALMQFSTNFTDVQRQEQSLQGLRGAYQESEPEEEEGHDHGNYRHT